jgi:hypothetical protein
VCSPGSGLPILVTDIVIFALRFGVLGGDGDLLIASGGLCRRWVPMSGT